MILNDFQLEHYLDSLEELVYFDLELNEEKDTQYVFDFLQYALFLVYENEYIDEDKKEEIKNRFEKYDIL
ncbi:hypothetical protein ACODM8_19150 [Vibrio ostreicida]|uniref:hypothetical protein n=1 Tax=Vibrio ostreicida TaxID=526588 RepID=UPI003B5BE1D3